MYNRNFFIFREEIRKKQGGEFSSPQPIAGGVRILPPSPVTVRKSQEHQSVQHRVHFQQDSETQAQHAEQILNKIDITFNGTTFMG